MENLSLVTVMKKSLLFVVVYIISMFHFDCHIFFSNKLELVLGIRNGKEL